VKHLGQLTSADLGKSGHVREAAPSKGATGRLTYLHGIASIRHYVRGGVLVTHLADYLVTVAAPSNSRWEPES
jgi:hypothetical protein